MKFPRILCLRCPLPLKGLRGQNRFPGFQLEISLCPGDKCYDSKKCLSSKFWRSDDLKTVLIFLTFIFALSGCNYELRETPKTAANSANTENSANAENPGKSASNIAPEEIDAEAVEGGELLITDTGRQSEIECLNREVEFDKDTTSNQIYFKGTCKKITVDGVANKITVEEVGQIIVKGVSNRVVYESGIGGGKPKIQVSGISTSAEKKETESSNENQNSTERKPRS